MADENKNERVNNKNDSLINLNIEYIELTEDNIKDINKYTNFDDYKFLSNFIRLMREFKDKDKYLYYVFNAIEELDIISLYGQNDERISFITKNDDNYKLIFEIIDNPLIKLKIIKTLYTIHDNKNNDYKSKNIRTYIQYLQSNWKLYLPYFNSDKHIYTEVFTDLIYLLQKTGSKDSYNNLIEKLIDEYCNFDISNYKINMYVDLFINVDKKYNERIYNKLILYINNVIDNNIIDSYYHAEQASVIARRFCKINSDDYWKTYQLEASVYIKQAEYRTDSRFVMSNYYNKAYQTYLKIEKNYRIQIITEDELKTLKDIMLKTQKSSLDDMILIKSPEIDIEPIVLETEKYMKNKSFTVAMDYFTNIELIANYNELLKEAKESQKSFPLQNMLTKVIYNKKGQKKDSFTYNANQNEYEMYLHNMIQTNQVDISLKTKCQIYPALTILLKEHNESITKEFLYEIIRILQINQTTKLLIVEGLYYGFKKEFIAAIHILIPQIENILRNLILPTDNSLVNIDKDGKDTYKGLNTILSEEYRESMWKQIGPDIYIDLKTLLDDEKGGLNLRNDLSHGLLSYDECNSAYSIYLWWLVFTWFYFLYKQNKK